MTEILGNIALSLSALVVIGAICMSIDVFIRGIKDRGDKVNE